MDKKRIIIIGGLLSLLVLTGVLVFFLTNNSSDNQGNKPTKEKTQKAEPALTREKDEATEEQEKVEAEKQRVEDEKNKNGNDKDKKEVVKQTSKSLESDAEYVLSKTIIGTSGNDTKLNEKATKKFASNIPSTDDLDGDKKKVEIKHVSLDLGKKPDMKADELKGTLKFDLIIKPKKGSDIKPQTQIDSKRAIKFEREDNKLKVNELRS
ncbi:hypothetical protein [Staphylococcus gallinarum]|uniref:hypothetical protein n=1 Tax=Staphylococcus gallinarum TaxID=1293 RepID=UPI001E5913F6|nr:hypothetical protein [Staphylococcus gallinarum]MCD8845166.1 hypothetical protein [Staphylococcus gallinarum]